MQERTVSHAETYAAASRGDQYIAGHLRSCLRNEIEPTAMHREQNVWFELLDLTNHLREVILWCRAKMEAANDRMYLGNTGYLLGLAHGIDDADVTARGNNH